MFNKFVVHYFTAANINCTQKKNEFLHPLKRAPTQHTIRTYEGLSHIGRLTTRPQGNPRYFIKKYLKKHSVNFFST